jgi:hypothetical protein
MDAPVDDLIDGLTDNMLDDLLDVALDVAIPNKTPSGKTFDELYAEITAPRYRAMFASGTWELSHTMCSTKSGRSVHAPAFVDGDLCGPYTCSFTPLKSRDASIGVESSPVTSWPLLDQSTVITVLDTKTRRWAFVPLPLYLRLCLDGFPGGLLFSHGAGRK